MAFLVLFILNFNISKELKRAENLYLSALYENNIDPSNPFYYFINAIEKEKAGAPQEANKFLEIAKQKANLDFFISFLMFKISEEEKIERFKDILWKYLLESKKKSKIEEVPQISEYFYKKAKATPFLSQAVDYLNKALLFSPSFYPAFLYKLELYYLNSKWFNLLKEIFKAPFVFKNNPITEIVYNLFQLRFLSVIFYLLVFIFGLGVLILKRNIFLYYAYSLISNVKGVEFTPAFVYTALFIIGAPIAILYLIILPFFAFLERREKLVAFIPVFLFLFLPYFKSKEKKMEILISDSNSPLRLYYSVKTGQYSDDIIEFLKKTDNLYLKELLLTIYLREDNIKEAYNVIKELKNKLKTPSFYTNIGNYYFIKNKIDSADIFYKKAVSIDPYNYEANFNLAQTALLRVDLETFNNQIKIINSIDKERTEKLTELIQKYNIEPYVIAFPSYDLIHKNTKIYFKKARSLIDILFFPSFLFFESLVLIFFIFFFNKRIEFDICSSCFAPLILEGEEIEPIGRVCEICKKDLSVPTSSKLRERLTARLRTRRKDRLRFYVFISNVLLPGLGFFINSSYLGYLFSSIIFSISLFFLFFTDFKIIGFLLYFISILPAVFYYLGGGRVNENI